MSVAHEVLIGIKAFSSNGIDLLKKIVTDSQFSCEINQVSSIYQIVGEHEAPQHVHDLKTFESYDGLSVVIAGSTSVEPDALLQELQALEKKYRSEVLHRNASLNLLLYEDQTIMTPDLTLPHPEFHNRPEFLIPAAEVWGKIIHPVLKESIFKLAGRYQEEKWGEFYAQGKTLLDFSPIGL